MMPKPAATLRQPMDIKTSEIMGMIRNDIRRVELALRGEIGQIRDDLGRHIDAVAESLRDDIRNIVEDRIAGTAKDERLRAKDEH
jgi:hypothetical protein